jgi:hypothetical protein
MGRQIIFPKETNLINRRRAFIHGTFILDYYRNMVFLELAIITPRKITERGQLVCSCEFRLASPNIEFSFFHPYFKRHYNNWQLHIFQEMNAHPEFIKHHRAPSIHSVLDMRFVVNFLKYNNISEISCIDNRIFNALCSFTSQNYLFGCSIYHFHVKTSLKNPPHIPKEEMLVDNHHHHHHNHEMVMECINKCSPQSCVSNRIIYFLTYSDNYCYNAAHYYTVQRNLTWKGVY